MIVALWILMTCMSASCFSAVLSREKDGECPHGARCLPMQLCGTAASSEPVQLRRPFRCGHPASRDLNVCCWENSALAPLPLRAFRRRSLPAPKPSENRHTLPVHPRGPRLPNNPPTLLPTTSPSPKPKSASKKLSASEQACNEYRQFKQMNSRKKRELELIRPLSPKINIVGGERARTAEFSYMVAIGYVSGNLSSNTSELLWGCGGSLISNRYVLTAAHCITDGIKQNIHPKVLRTGVNHLTQGVRRPDDFLIEKITLHPQHKADLKYFDLALLRTDRPVNFSASEIPVCLANSTTHLDSSTPLIVAGWGAVDPAGFEMSAHLKKADLLHVPMNDCKTFIQNTTSLPRGLDENMICAAEPERKSDTCQGDSGGPLVKREPEGDVLVGVTSFGSRPCAGRPPAVYASVLSQLSWIESIVWPKPVPSRG